MVLIDDQALFREGVVEIFAAEDDIRVVGEAENGLEAVALAEREQAGRGAPRRGDVHNGG